MGVVISEFRTDLVYYIFFFNCAIVLVNDFFVFMKEIKIAFKFKELNSCSLSIQRYYYAY